MDHHNVPSKSGATTLSRQDKIGPPSKYGSTFREGEKGATHESPVNQSSDNRQFNLPHVLLASLAVFMARMTVGFSAGYTSPAIPNLNAHPNPFHVTLEEQSWIISLMYAGAVAGSILSIFLVDRLGRLFTLMVMVVPTLIGWLIVAAAPNAATMMAGRLLLGITEASIMMASGVYLAEMAPAHIRGLLFVLTLIGLDIAIMSTSVLGVYVSWNWLAIIGLAPVFAMLLLLTSLPETPLWLQMKGRTEEARKVHVWFYGEHPTPRCPGVAVTSGGDGVLSWFSFLRRPYLRLMVTCQLIHFMNAVSGLAIVFKYAVTIFQWTGSDLNPYSQSIVVSAMNLLGTGLGAITVERFSRRGLFVASASVVSAGWLTMGAFFFLEDTELAGHLSLMPLLALVLVVLGCGVGQNTIPMIVTNEMFPTRARGRACIVGEMMYCAGAFVATKAFPTLTVTVGYTMTFWVCAGVGLLQLVFAYSFLPETKGVDLDEVEKRFRSS